MKTITIFGLIIILIIAGLCGCTSINKNKSEETGIVSGRILSDNISFRPVYDASVLVNGQPAEIYGTTYLALNVSIGEATVEAHDSEGQTMTETLTVEPSVVNSADVIFPADEAGVSPIVTSTSDHLQFLWSNGMSVELKLNGDELLGIGDVKVNEIPLRKPLSSGTFTIEKIEGGTFVGIGYTKCQYLSYETKGVSVVVHSMLITGEGNIGVDWIFTPWNMTAEGNLYTGVGYRFSIFSPVDISKIGFNCSWELNGDVIGKTLFTRREHADWERNCTQSDGFSIDTRSLFVQSQPPDYQYDDSGSLASFIWPPGEVENTLQKNSGSDQLWFYDTFSFGETKQAETPFRVILYSSKAGLDEYTYLFDQVSENYRSFYGEEEVLPIPTVLANTYLQQGIQSGQAPLYRHVADSWLPEFANHNFKQILIIDVWTSNGRLGTPDKNRLATQSIDVYPDDVNDVKYLTNKTHSLGMKLVVWLSICYSQKSPTIPVTDWRTTNLDGSFNTAQSGDVYTLSYRSGYLAYAIERLRAIKTQFGFDGIWHDSFGAGSLTDYANTFIKPPIDQQMQYASATQRIGYTPYLEAISPFGMTGIGSVGVTAPNSPHGTRDMSTAFGGREYLAYKTSVILFTPNDFNPLQIDYYKFLANKAVPMIAYQLLNDAEKDSVSQANKDYNAASSYMDKRHVLSNETGVLWYDKESSTQILFAFKTFSYKLEGGITEVFDVTSNSVVKIESGGFTTQLDHTYKLQ